MLKNNFQQKNCVCIINCTHACKLTFPRKKLHCKLNGTIRVGVIQIYLHCATTLEFELKSNHNNLWRLIKNGIFWTGYTTQTKMDIKMKKNHGRFKYMYSTLSQKLVYHLQFFLKLRSLVFHAVINLASSTKDTKPARMQWSLPILPI